MSHARALLAALIAIAVLAPACQVSVFGSDPITLIGPDLGPGGERGRACAEPDDAARARSSADGCAERCTIDPAARTTDCESVQMGAPREGVATLDMRGNDGVVLTLEICDPAGTVVEIADAVDRARSAHDSYVRVEGATLHLVASEGSGVDPSAVRGWIAEAGCSTRTLVLSDQLVYLVEAEAGLCGAAMLRVDPPADPEGSPDALWYLAVGGTVDGSGMGTGLRSIALCYW